MAVHTGLEPVISSVTGRHVNHYTNGPIWLGYLDSNQGDVRIKIWCLTAWLYPNMVLAEGLKPPTYRLQGDGSIYWAMPAIILVKMTRLELVRYVAIVSKTILSANSNTSSFIIFYNLLIIYLPLCSKTIISPSITCT